MLRLVIVMAATAAATLLFALGAITTAQANADSPARPAHTVIVGR